jgi:hypothetical protein
MKLRISVVHRVIVLVLSLCAMGVLLSPSSAAAQQAFFVKPVAEKSSSSCRPGRCIGGWRFPNAGAGAGRRG